MRKIIQLFSNIWNLGVKIALAAQFNDQLRRCYEDVGRLAVSELRKEGGAHSKIVFETLTHVANKIEVFESKIKGLEEDMKDLRVKIKTGPSH